MRFEIRHRMQFRYSEPVTESHNEIRVRPQDDQHQQVLWYQLTSAPAARVLSSVDYWGTATEQLGVRMPHHELVLEAAAVVETSTRPAPEVDPALAALDDWGFRSDNAEFLGVSAHVAWSPGDELTRRAEAAAAGAKSVLGVVDAVVSEARGLLRYESGSTEIGVTLAELISGGAGVCQDFAHLAIGMLRSVGVPTRYVSGYLFAVDETVDPNEPDLQADDRAGDGSESADQAGGDEPAKVNVQTHAWIEAAIPGAGWYAVDPTNGGTAGPRHVVIGHGRDYGDVPPVRGVFNGAAEVQVDAGVTILNRTNPLPSTYKPAQQQQQQ